MCADADTGLISLKSGTVTALLNLLTYLPYLRNLAMLSSLVLCNNFDSVCYRYSLASYKRSFHKLGQNYLSRAMPQTVRILFSQQLTPATDFLNRHFTSGREATITAIKLTVFQQNYLLPRMQ